MIPSVVHAMIAAQDKERGVEMFLRLNCSVYLFDNAIHLRLLRNHVRTEYISVPALTDHLQGELPSWPGLMSNVIEAKIMHDHAIPVAPIQL